MSLSLNNSTIVPLLEDEFFLGQQYDNILDFAEINISIKCDTGYDLTYIYSQDKLTVDYQTTQSISSQADTQFYKLTVKDRYFKLRIDATDGDMTVLNVQTIYKTSTTFDVSSGPSANVVITNPLNQDGSVFVGGSFDISGQVVDISGQTVLVDISGQTVDISGQTVDISGQTVLVDISGQSVVVSGTVSTDISGQSVVVSGTVSTDISGQSVVVSGTVSTDISGQTVDISGQSVVVSGTVSTDISGQTVDISGQSVVVSGTVSTDISGQTVIVDISGQSVNIGNTVSTDTFSLLNNQRVSGQVWDGVQVAQNETSSAITPSLSSYCNTVLSCYGSSTEDAVIAVEFSNDTTTFYTTQYQYTLSAGDFGFSIPCSASSIRLKLLSATTTTLIAYINIC